jgi:glucose-6-phosphate isomerase
MDPAALWQELESHPMAGWLRPEEPRLPPLDPQARLVWCGIGGSLAPAAALVRALGTPLHQRHWTPLAGPDPEAPALRSSDQLVFASKSGRTLELWAWIAHLRTFPGWGRWQRPPLVLTAEDDNPLARLARSEGWPLRPLPRGVGGRYSAFTAVGALPLAWMERDAAAFVRGGRRVASEAATRQGPWGIRIWKAVELLVEGYRRGQRVWTLLPYGDRLQGLGGWWVQLLAESLGKLDRGGARIGFTAVPALGPQDQHAQLQRWMAGPRDLGICVLTVANHHREGLLAPPPACPYPELSRWKPSQILRAEAEGTLKALREAGVPVLHWHLEGGLTEAQLGALLMAWQIIVALTGLALEVNPFDQPDVETAKRCTEAMLGFEPHGAELEAPGARG